MASDFTCCGVKVLYVCFFNTRSVSLVLHGSYSRIVDWSWDFAGDCWSDGRNMQRRKPVKRPVANGRRRGLDLRRGWSDLAMVWWCYEDALRFLARNVSHPLQEYGFFRRARDPDKFY